MFAFPRTWVENDLFSNAIALPVYTYLQEKEIGGAAPISVHPRIRMLRTWRTRPGGEGW